MTRAWVEQQMLRCRVELGGMVMLGPKFPKKKKKGSSSRRDSSSSSSSSSDGGSSSSEGEQEVAGLSRAMKKSATPTGVHKVCRSRRGSRSRDKSVTDDELFAHSFHQMGVSSKRARILDIIMEGLDEPGSEWVKESVLDVDVRYNTEIQEWRWQTTPGGVLRLRLRVNTNGSVTARYSKSGPWTIFNVRTEEDARGVVRHVKDDEAHGVDEVAAMMRQMQTTPPWRHHPYNRG